MRDILLIMPSEATDEWNLDIDIVNGFPKFVPYERTTQDQRAALSAYTIKGTIPGKPNVGINWGRMYDANENTLTSIDNEIKQAIQQNAAIPNGPNSMYTPVYEQKDGSIQLTIYQG